MVNEKGQTMTINQMQQELRSDLRALTRKIDANHDANHAAHAAINEKLSKIETVSVVNKTKLAGFVVLITMIVAGAVNYSFHVMGK